MAAVILTVVTIAVILALNRGKNKIPVKLAVCIVGLEIVGTVFSLSGGSGSIRLSRIKRPEAGSTAEEHEVTVKQGDREEKLTLRIPARKLTDSEAEKAVETVKKQIKKEYLGKNKSADSVYRDLKLRSKYRGNVEAEWEIKPYDIFDSEGKIDNSKAEKETAVSIRGYLDCQGKTGEVEMQVTAIPIPMETADGFSYYLKKAVTEANEKNPTSDYVKLPEKVGGKGLIFSEKRYVRRQSGNHNSIR